MNIPYIHSGDYLLPNLETPEAPKISIWGQRRYKYLREHKKVLYTGWFHILFAGNHA